MRNEEGIVTKLCKGIINGANGIMFVYSFKHLLAHRAIGCVWCFAPVIIIVALLIAVVLIIVCGLILAFD